MLIYVCCCGKYKDITQSSLDEDDGGQCSTVPKVGKLVVCDSHILLYEWMTAKGTQCMSMSGL